MMMMLLKSIFDIYTYIGSPPLLFLKNETDETIEEIDLSEYSTEGLHALMLEKVNKYLCLCV
jgi:hypothetical protein